MNEVDGPQKGAVPAMRPRAALADSSIVIPVPATWPVAVVDSQDRWTLLIPGTTVHNKQVHAYHEKTNAVPPPGWHGEQFGSYVRVTWKPSKGRVRQTVLKVDVQDADGTDHVSLSPLVFGRKADGEELTLTPSSRAEHRRARLNTGRGRLRVGALTAGIVSTWITACFGIGRAAGHAAFRFSSDAVSGLLIVAAVLAAASALSLFYAAEIVIDDVPDKKLPTQPAS